PSPSTRSDHHKPLSAECSARTTHDVLVSDDDNDTHSWPAVDAPSLRCASVQPRQPRPILLPRMHTHIGACPLRVNGCTQGRMLRPRALRCLTTTATARAGHRPRHPAASCRASDGHLFDAGDMPGHLCLGRAGCCSLACVVVAALPPRSTSEAISPSDEG